MRIPFAALLLAFPLICSASAPARTAPGEKPTIILAHGASHAVMVSHPAEVAALIEDAASGK